jgi:hypothetical protein
MCEENKTPHKNEKKRMCEENKTPHKKEKKRTRKKDIPHQSAP